LSPKTGLYRPFYGQKGRLPQDVAAARPQPVIDNMDDWKPPQTAKQKKLLPFIV
jgi:hypothetical protein